ncbi:hypothetical protein [Streptomyces sp. Ru72]|uniref:hypothetical protein n=1 Tax=Streptomyces sp. Ru72 TaxID=2080747 RepID=UPI0021566A3F|nr:hypothetical protein [Streptomyces sp. Ru72]
MAEQKSSSPPMPLRAVARPVRDAASVLGRLPGAQMVGRAAEGTLEKVGAVSPRGRRLAVYAGAGVLGAVGVVEWPLALTGAAVAWLTQSRPQASGQAPAQVSESEATASAAPRPRASRAKKPPASAPGPARSKKPSASSGRDGSGTRRARTAG